MSYKEQVPDASRVAEETKSPRTESSTRVFCMYTTYITDMVAYISSTNKKIIILLLQYLHECYFTVSKMLYKSHRMTTARQAPQPGQLSGANPPPRLRPQGARRGGAPRGQPSPTPYRPPAVTHHLRAAHRTAPQTKRAGRAAAPGPPCLTPP